VSARKTPTRTSRRKTTAPPRDYSRSAVERVAGTKRRARAGTDAKAAGNALARKARANKANPASATASTRQRAAHDSRQAARARGDATGSMPPLRPGPRGIRAARKGSR
jgi:septal ring-binding cell division protein DamX